MRAVDAVYAAAARVDPSIDPAVGRLLAASCLTAMADEPSLDPTELARRALASADQTVDPAWVVRICRAAVAVKARRG
jgi:hypothetical protein